MLVPGHSFHVSRKLTNSQIVGPVVRYVGSLITNNWKDEGTNSTLTNVMHCVPSEIFDRFIIRVQRDLCL